MTDLMNKTVLLLTVVNRRSCLRAVGCDLLCAIAFFLHK